MLSPVATQKASSRGRVQRTYRWLGTQLLTTSLLFGGMNVVAVLLLAAGLGVSDAGPLRYGVERLRPAYPGRSDQEIRQLLTEVWSRPYVYEPFTQFRERGFSGRYLNVRPEGFRSSGRFQPWPPDPSRRNVFVFGGSTAFGYGLSDEEALPAQLEAALRSGGCGDEVTVYNLARSNYYSSQERILFEQLALHGIEPAMAVFLDGLNEFAHANDEPKFTDRLRYLMSETPGQTFRRWLVNLPLSRLVKGLRREDDAPPASNREASPEEVVARWLRNKRFIEALGAELGVAMLFTWQPVALWDYDPSRYPAVEGGLDQLPGAAAMARGYAQLDALRRAGDPRLAAPDFLWLADGQSELHDPPYVDRGHYSAALTRSLARRLGRAVEARLCDALRSESPTGARLPATEPGRG